MNTESTDARIKQILLEVASLQQSLKQEKASRERLEETVTRLSKTLDTHLRASCEAQSYGTPSSSMSYVSLVIQTGCTRNPCAF